MKFKKKINVLFKCKIIEHTFFFLNTITAEWIIAAKATYTIYDLKMSNDKKI